MGRSLLSRVTRRLRADRAGFTLVEVMTAMAIGVTALTANLYLFNFAQRNLAESRSMTDATNLAGSKIADFKTMDVGAIAGGNDVQSLNGIAFTRTWTVSGVDVDHDGAADMVGDIVKVRLSVTWTINGRSHEVVMATMTTGKAS